MSYIRHKSNITCILNSQYDKKDKEKEYLFTTSYDGLILIWTIEAIEMKLSKNSNEEDESKMKKKEEVQKTYNRVEVLLSILDYDNEKIKKITKNKKS